MQFGRLASQSVRKPSWTIDVSGHSGLRVPALSASAPAPSAARAILQGLGLDRCRRRHAADRCLPRSRRLDVRQRRRLFRRRGRGDPGCRDQGQARPRADLHQGDLPDRRRPERFRLVAPASAGDGRGFAEAARHRSHRPAAAPRPGLQHAGRGDLGDARRSSCARARCATSAARISPAGT